MKKQDDFLKDECHSNPIKSNKLMGGANKKWTDFVKNLGQNVECQSQFVEKDMVNLSRQ